MISSAGKSHDCCWETNVYNSLGQLEAHYDFKGQPGEFVYDQYGRVTNKFYFVAGETQHPSNSVAYVYNQLGELWWIIERSGNQAGPAYAWLGNGNDQWMAGRAHLAGPARTSGVRRSLGIARESPTGHLRRLGGFARLRLGVGAHPVRETAGVCCEGVTH